MKYKKLFVIMRFMNRATGNCCSLEYLTEKTSVDKEEVPVHLYRLTDRDIIGRKCIRVGKERMYCLKYKEEML